MCEFVNFSIAKKLKEKGFNEVCYNYYEPLKHCLNQIKTPWTNKEGESYGVVTAPTISQVLKWLRKTHNIFIMVFLDDDSDNPVTFEIYKGVKCVTDYHIKYYPLDEWSKAEMDAIEYVIDNLI